MLIPLDIEVKEAHGGFGGKSQAADAVVTRLGAQLHEAAQFDARLARGLPRLSSVLEQFGEDSLGSPAALSAGARFLGGECLHALKLFAVRQGFQPGGDGAGVRKIVRVEILHHRTRGPKIGCHCRQLIVDHFLCSRLVICLLERK